MSDYLERLAASSARVGAPLCIGIDPDPAALPERFRASPAQVGAWVDLLIEATSASAAAYKVNLAFFEALGAEGIAIAERIRHKIPSAIPLIIDVKRGDIGSTVAAQDRALYERLEADAVTANPYLGIGALAPLLARTRNFTYLLCRTSNPEAAEFQELRVVGGGLPDEPLYLRVARLATERPEALAGRIGLVVGATVGDALRLAREVAPGLPFLVPGVGAQGGDAAAVLATGQATAGSAAGRFGGGLTINVGRGVTDAAREAVDPGAALSAAAGEWRARLAILPADGLPPAAIA
ncbi:MAG: orotidine-5'-phosphate decarboxylase [Candidatus Limnocylindrus sp.]